MELTRINVKNEASAIAPSSDSQNARTSLLKRGGHSLYSESRPGAQSSSQGEFHTGEPPRTGVPEYVYYEKALEPSDTIAKLALKFSVSGFELKRVNKLLRDQDLFSRSTIRIPLPKHGIIAASLLPAQEQDAAPVVPNLVAMRRIEGDIDSVTSEEDNGGFSTYAGAADEEDVDNSETASLLDRMNGLRSGGGVGGSGGDRWLTSWSKRDRRRIEKLLSRHDASLANLAEDSRVNEGTVDDVIATVDGAANLSLGEGMLFRQQRPHHWCPLSADSWISVRCLVVIVGLAVVIGLFVGIFTYYQTLYPAHHEGR